MFERLRYPQAIVKEKFVNLRAEYAEEVAANTTYLISTQAGVDKGSAKVKTALERGVLIVSFG